MTKAEAEVCRLLVDGFSNVEIAEKRITQPDTIKSQVARVLAKTGVRNRTELVRLACQSSPPIATIKPYDGLQAGDVLHFVFQRYSWSLSKPLAY